MRAIQTFVFSIIFCSLTLFAEEAAELKSSQLNLDELITKMNNADVSERFKYMNKIKKHLKQMNANQRIDVLNKLQERIDASKAASIPKVRNTSVRPAMPSTMPMQPTVMPPSIPSMPGH